MSEPILIKPVGEPVFAVAPVLRQDGVKMKEGKPSKSKAKPKGRGRFQNAKTSTCIRGKVTKSEEPVKQEESKQ